MRGAKGITQMTLSSPMVPTVLQTAESLQHWIYKLYIFQIQVKRRKKGQERLVNNMSIRKHNREYCIMRRLISAYFCYRRLSIPIEWCYQRLMHQICDWVEYHEFTLYVVNVEPMKIPTLSAPQNDRPNLVLVKDINISVLILIGFKVVT